MREFDKTILIKWNKVWQPADASITDLPDGSYEAYFKLNGRVYYLAPGQKDFPVKLLDHQMSNETAHEYATDMNTWELDNIIAMEQKKEEEARYQRLQNYRVNQAVRNARGGP